MRKPDGQVETFMYVSIMEPGIVNAILDIGSSKDVIDVPDEL